MIREGENARVAELGLDTLHTFLFLKKGGQIIFSASEEGGRYFAMVFEKGARTFYVFKKGARSSFGTKSSQKPLFPIRFKESRLLSKLKSGAWPFLDF